jgi:hypothetical protein
MTTTELLQLRAVRTVLFGNEENAVRALKETFASSPVAGVLGTTLAGLSSATRNAAVGELSRVVSGLLSLDLADVILAGWRKHGALVAAARRTAAAPGAHELVEVVTHTISWSDEPYVELFVDEVRVATVHLQLTLDLDVKALVAAVAGGRLVGVRSGSCTVRAALSAEGGRLAEHTAYIELPLELPLGSGVPLLLPPSGQPMGSEG